MLLIDAARAGDPAWANELLASFPRFAPEVQIRTTIHLGHLSHPRFPDAVELVLAAPLPVQILGGSTGGVGSGASMASFGDVTTELFEQLGQAILARSPGQLGKLLLRLPDDVQLLSTLAQQALEAQQREAALALYDRLLALPLPDDGDDRMNYLRALNNACVLAHAAGAFEAAVRISERAAPVAHENPYLYHSAACAYAAVQDHARAFEQVKLAVAHDYEHLAKVETDRDLGPLIEWPEFKALFQDWRTRREGN
jgi:tetratricopeptide (TPR) repeat protein